ncbi:MAG: HAD family hydrolase [Geobacteraceae bacterium]|nr:HAD family hydrolase [Geobacteraceae bacterium]
MRKPLNDIRGIVFDLDGTLYVSPSFATAIQDAAADCIARIKSIEPGEAGRLLADTRKRMIEERDEIPTLSAVCSELGGNVRDLHTYFASCLQPEDHLARDPRVITLLENLSKSRALYLFTNNNTALTNRIIGYLGLNGLFRRIYTINDSWKGKPDEDMLDRILAESGLLPSQALFVGDRYDVDLRLPEQRGCPVYLSQSIEQLLRLEELLKA